MTFPWNRAESQLNGEIAHHLRELTAEYVRQGYSPEDAARQARKEFGGAEQFKEQCRDERRFAWLTGFRQDIVFGLRMMRRTPVVTAAAVLSLALGIGANTAIISLMDVVMWRHLPVDHPEQLSFIDWSGTGFPRGIADAASGSTWPDGGMKIADFFSYPSYESFHRNAAKRAQIAAYLDSRQVSISFAGRPIVGEERDVTGNFLPLLRVRPFEGRLLSDADDNPAAAPAVVLSHSFWANTLGSPEDAIGHTITINHQSFTVAGVLSKEFYGLFPSDKTDLYAPLHHAGKTGGAWGGPDDLSNNRYWGVHLIARRTPGVTNAQLQSTLDAIFPTTWSQRIEDPSQAPHVHMVDGASGDGALRREFRSPLLVLGALVGLLLTIACTNIANLLLARATARRNEMAARISLGCSRSRLMRQFFTESALLALLGGVASIAIAFMAANLLGRFVTIDASAPLSVALDSRVFAIVGVCTAAALLVFGLFPAWHSSRVPSGLAAREGTGVLGYSGLTRWTGGRLLVLVQMAMSVILVMTAVMFTRNLLAIENADPGFDRRNLVMFGLRPGTSGYETSRLPIFYSNVEKRLSTIPGVEVAGLASTRPMNVGGRWESIRLSGGAESFTANVNGISPSYLSLYTQGLVAGRNFTQADINSASKVAILSEDLARRLGGNSVIGRSVEFTDGPPGARPDSWQVIGIAPVMIATSMKDHPYVLWLPRDREAKETTVVMRTGPPPRAMLPSIRRAVAEIDPNVPLVEVTTMEEQIAKGLQRERMFATLCGGFGVLALVLSVVGLYGVMAYSISRRRGEIGVRLALGARPLDVLAMVLREGLVLAGAGILIGVPVIFLGAKYVAKELYQMKPIEPVTVSLTLGILLLSAIAAISIPALRASALEPSETLRQE
ncbi:MAG TPA: ABC transporter permease [Bryobacteraceae bacterium]|nr:ABC transporter permease [Bryobacteraceae bacterium]